MGKDMSQEEVVGNLPPAAQQLFGELGIELERAETVLEITLMVIAQYLESMSDGGYMRNASATQLRGWAELRRTQGEIIAFLNLADVPEDDEDGQQPMLDPTTFRKITGLDG